MKQITEDYCNKEVSALLKEKGFDVPVKNYFSLNKDAMLHNLDKKYGAKKNWNAFEICISRPSQSLALKWLREVYNLTIDVFHFRDWKVNIKTIPDDYFKADYSYPELKPAESYEQAVEAAIKYTLENLI